MSHTYRLQILLNFCLGLHFNIILPYTLRSLNLSLSITFPHQNLDALLSFCVKWLSQRTYTQSLTKYVEQCQSWSYPSGPSPRPSYPLASLLSLCHSPLYCTRLRRPKLTNPSWRCLHCAMNPAPCSHLQTLACPPHARRCRRRPTVALVHANVSGTVH